MNSKELGKLGEDIAVKYLENKGYTILDRNFNLKLKACFVLKSEIDIIAQKKDITHFIEVKALTNNKNLRAFGGPEQKVNQKKKVKIEKAAQSWLSKRKIPFDSKWQIDAIAINLDFKKRKAKISYFENI